MATIYARDTKRLYPNSGGGYVTRCKLFTTTTPDTFPTTGSGIVGMEALDTFAAGSELIAITAKKIWLVGSDGGSFEVQKVWSEVDLNPETKTSDMTQEVGKDASGKLWTVDTGYKAENIYTGSALTEAVSQIKIYGNTNLLNYDKLLLHMYLPANSSATGDSALMVTTCNSSGESTTVRIVNGQGFTFQRNYYQNLVFEIEKIYTSASTFRFAIKMYRSGYSSQGYMITSYGTVNNSDYYSVLAGFIIEPSNTANYPTFPVGTQVTLTGVKK